MKEFPCEIHYSHTRLDLQVICVIGFLNKVLCGRNDSILRFWKLCMDARCEWN
jgi:hypothetical protein